MEGIEWGRSDAFLDEIPGAYKPVDVVMADAADLVDARAAVVQVHRGRHEARCVKVRHRALQLGLEVLGRVVVARAPKAIDIGDG